MKKIYISIPVDDHLLEEITKLGYEVLDENNKYEAQILIGFSPKNPVDISKFKVLEIIQLPSIGFNHLPLDEIRDHSITVCNNQGAYSSEMGEWAVLKVLEIYKKNRQIEENQRSHEWKLVKGLEEISDKKALILGTGTIGSHIASRLRAFGVTIVGFNSDARDVEYFDRCINSNSLMKELSTFDMVISALPLTKKTEHLIDDRFLESMKEFSVLINISRGAIIDEKALISHVDKFKGVSLDVFEEEPLPRNHPLWNEHNVYISSHNSWISQFNRLRTNETIISNLKRIKDQQSLINVVDLTRGY